MTCMLLGGRERSDARARAFIFLLGPIESALFFFFGGRRRGRRAPRSPFALFLLVGLALGIALLSPHPSGPRTSTHTPSATQQKPHQQQQATSLSRASRSSHQVVPLTLRRLRFSRVPPPEPAHRAWRGERGRSRVGKRRSRSPLVAARALGSRPLASSRQPRNDARRRRKHTPLFPRAEKQSSNDGRQQERQQARL